MAVSTHITNHAEQALSRLPDKQKGKAYIEGLLTSDASARVDVRKIEVGSTYTITIDSNPYTYIAVSGDDKSAIADGLVAAVNVGAINQEASKFDGADDYLYIRSKNAGESFVLSVSSTILYFTRLMIIDQIQELEDALNDLLLYCSVDTAEGANLDAVGQIVGLRRRGGESDDDYRAAIKVQVQINLSKGEGNRLLQIVKFYTDSTIVNLLEQFPAFIKFEFNGQTVPSDLKQRVDDAVAGGVQIEMTQGPAPPLIPFGFLGSAAPSAGFNVGYLVSVIT